MSPFLFNILILFSHLPLKILYAFSDVFFFLNYYIIGYRKKVVRQNLTIVFPEKTEVEIKRIEKKFFRNFSDFIIETLKIFTISEKNIEKLITYQNVELFEDAFRKKKNVIILSGHNFNWELAIFLGTKIPQKNYSPIYRKLQNPFWNQKIIQSREKFGSKLLEAREVMKHFLKQPNDGNSVYAFLSDQTPHATNIQFGLEFLNQKTPAFTGYNRLPGKENMIFCFAEILKIKRGKYQMCFTEITPEKDHFEGEELVVKFHQMLEKVIYRHPENWLWTHKKWKYAHVLTEAMMYKGPY